MTQSASPFPRGLMIASWWSSAYSLHSALPPSDPFRQLSKQVKQRIGEGSKSRSPLNICKTQNSGLRSKEEKPSDPINQPSRCNTQEGLLSVAQTGDSDLLGGRAHRIANWASFLYAKKTYYQHITYGLQSDWLHVCKAILLVQTSWALVQT